MATYPVILGTAGHIDHGKTSLVRALTGMDTDRLKEEKERGITIELGFAHLDVDGRRFGVVDVPGHERFIKTMVAGAGGVDVVMLVVAADEGIMPQTREHLDICQLLGVQEGVVVLTKSDLVDDAWLELVRADVRAAVAGTFLQESAMLAVSATAGTGLTELKTELVRLADALPLRSAGGVLRLPLDRVFTMKGFGTVVTGTIVDGRLCVGEDVQFSPSGKVGKVRGLQVHGETVAEAKGGMRCAVNVGGVDRTEIARGEMLIHPGTLEPTHLLDVRLTYLRTCKAALGRRSRAIVHHATAQVMAAIVLVDKEILEPGEEGLVQLHLETPVCALPGDRFIARGFSPQEHYGTTIGGGEIVRVLAPKLRRSSLTAAATIRQLAEAGPVLRVALEVRSAGPAGISRLALQARLGLEPSSVDAALQRLVLDREVLCEADLFLHSDALARLEHAALAAVDAFHADCPQKEGLAREELRSRLARALPQKLFGALLGQLVERGVLVAERDIVRRTRHAPLARNGVAELLEAQFVAWALEPPRPQDFAQRMGKPENDVRAALEVLVKTGQVVRIKPDYYVAKSALDRLREKLRDYLRAHGQITPQDWKTLTGTSRKYSIPLAEHFDTEKLTLRVGDLRKPRG